jgi:endonuclease YncB( thermonuclease family)
MHRSLLGFVPVFALLFSLVLPMSALAATNPEGVPKSAEAFKVSGHIDGDSFYVDTVGDRQETDLLGIDAPETNKQNGECFSKEALAQLKKLAPKGSNVYLETEEGHESTNSDTWLRDVWVEGKNGKKALLINTKLVRDGFAAVDEELNDGKYGERLKAAEIESQEANHGIWNVCGGPHEKFVPTPTPSPTPPPTPTVDEIKAQYVPLADVRELAIRPGGMIGQKIVFYGTILTIRVANPGQAFFLGDNDEQPYGVALQVTVSAPDGSTETLFVGFDGDTTGMFEGSWIVVYGSVVDTQTGTNLLGGIITQLLIAAQFVELA